MRIGNCSGFYGDRLSAMREMLEGGELDVLTGDYLAELTLLILGRDRLRDPSLGYARTFLRQAEDCLGLALERRVKLVSNAGGLNPAGLAVRLRETAAALGVEADVAHVEGDDLLPRAAELGLGTPLTANAYLGGAGIAAALRAGADVVVTGRVADASLVVGPAVAHYGWDATDLDALAGATVAGHVLECGTHATGGNFSGFLELGPDARPLGFPLAEIAADGSCVITKHPGTGGAVTRDTVTAQLVYEIHGPVYLTPDVSVRLDTVRLADDGPDRVRISGTRGEPPPVRLKVCVNELGGHRNAVELALVGPDVDAKAAWVREQLTAALGKRAPESVEWTLVRGREDAASQEEASARLRCAVRDRDADAVGRRFSNAVVELALASYPGFQLTAPPASGTPFGVYRAGYVGREAVEHVTVHADGRRERLPDPPVTADPPRVDHPPTAIAPRTGSTRRVPLGTVAHARSGDKGGDANVGVWPRDARADRAGWLRETLTEQRVKELLPEAKDCDVEVHPLPDLGAVNVVLHGLLGEGVAASGRFDPQAKGLAEWLRAQPVDVPEELL